MLDEACIDNKVKEFYKPKDEVGSRNSQFTETNLIKQANSYWMDLDAACKAVNTSMCLTGRRVADERSVTITDVHKRFDGSSRVYPRAREAVHVLVLAMQPRNNAAYLRTSVKIRRR